MPTATKADLEAAFDIVHPIFPGTPQYVWPLLAQRLGCEVWVKHENHTPIGAFKIPEESIGRVIGPGGKQIRAIIEDFELSNMDVQEDGSIQMTSLNTEKLKSAEEFVMDLISAGNARGGSGKKATTPKPTYAGPEPEVGAVYKGKITGVHQFGVFIEIIPGASDGSYPGLEGLCHVSELHTERIRNCEAFMNSLGIEEMEVKYLGKNERGKLQLSRKAVLEDKKATNGSGRNAKEKNLEEAGKLTQEEVDVIAQAIEGLQGI